MEKIVLHLKRVFKGKKYTIGHLYINDEYFCDTIEDVVRILNTEKDKVYGETAIPEGIYEVIITYSQKFKRRLPLLKDVPFFTGIRIHRGNTEKDSLGCIIVGENKIKGKVVNSTITENKLMGILTGCKDIKIIID